MLLGTLKCAETVWDELCKGQVYEVRRIFWFASIVAAACGALTVPSLQYEDVHLSLSGQSFTELLASAFPPLPVSPLRVAPAGEAAGERVVSVDDVLEALDVAQNWLVDNMDDSPTRDGLLGRIAIRMVRSPVPGRGFASLPCDALRSHAFLPVRVPRKQSTS